MLFDYLQGLSGCPDEYETSLKTKSKVFILGDSFGSLDAEAIAADKDGKAEKADRTEIAKKLDDILNQLSVSLDNNECD